MPRTLTFQNRMPALSVTSVEYNTLLGVGTSAAGCRPMPNKDGILSEPGRDKESGRKRAAGAWSTGVMEKRLDAQAAPSGSFVVTAGICAAIMEFRGRAKPKI